VDRLNAPSSSERSWGSHSQSRDGSTSTIRNTRIRRTFDPYRLLQCEATYPLGRIISSPDRSLPVGEPIWPLKYWMYQRLIHNFWEPSECYWKELLASEITHYAIGTDRFQIYGELEVMILQTV
jgi:hypothetical protein